MSSSSPATYVSRSASAFCSVTSVITGAPERDRGSRHIERAFGRFERTLRVPRGLDPDAIRAPPHDGVLTLQIPKPESLKPRKIQVQGDQSEARELEGATR